MDGLSVSWKHKVNFIIVGIALLLLTLGNNFLVLAQTNATALGDLVARMGARSWAELQTIGLTKDLVSSNGDFRHVLEYTDKAVWYPAGEKLFFIGGGHYAGMEFISYDAKTNTWQELSDPYWFSGVEICHAYHCNAIDFNRGLLFFLMCDSRMVYQFNIEKNQWSQLPENTSGSQSFAMALEYFPEIDGLVHVINGEVNILNKRTSQWSTLAKDLAMGDYHNFAEYNPVHKVVLLGGGNDSNKMYKLSANGQITALRPAPFSLAISRALITVDPVSGDYLIFGGNDKFYAYNIAADGWTPEPSPTVPIFEKAADESNIFGCIATPVAGYGVTMFVKLVLEQGAQVYLYKHSDAGTPDNILKVGPGRTYKKPSDAAAAAKDGDAVEIDTGEYRGDAAVWTQNNLTMRGVGGRAYLNANGIHAQGKGTWVVKGSNTTIENIEFSGATVPDHNGAAIRQEGRNLTVRNCFFHDNENGILTDDDLQSEILIEYSEFARNGRGDGYTHNMYISRVGRFTLRYSYSHHARIGHNVKSRAQENHLLYNRIMDEQDGTSSYAIDLPNGGLTYVIGNLMQQGPQTENSGIVTYGAEGLSHTQNEFYLVNNTMVNDHNTGQFVSIATGTAKAKLINNLFVGPGTVLSGAGEQITNLTTSSPRFVNKDLFDYRLTNASPAINVGSSPGLANGVDLTPVYHYTHPLTAKVRPRDERIDIGAFEFSAVTSTEELNRVPENFVLEQNYPNPFNPSTIVHFGLPTLGNVRLTIYNTAGQLVRQLVSGPMEAGVHEVVWDGTDNRGRRLSSGVYLCKFQVDDFVAQKRLILTK